MTETKRPTIASTNARIDEFKKETDERLKGLDCTTLRLSANVGATAREAFDADITFLKGLQGAIVIFTTVFFIEFFTALGSAYESTFDCFLVGIKIFLMLYLYYNIGAMRKARTSRFVHLFVEEDE